MKADDGSLGYVSALEVAEQAGASASDPELNQAIQNWNAGNVYTVARVSCFRDNKAPYAVPSLGIKTNSGYNWRDQEDLRWMSPTSEEARAYVVDVCVELAELGFDEILLDNSAYPTQGHLEYIKRGGNYDQSRFQEIITAFYTQVETALAAYPDVKLSIRTGEMCSYPDRTRSAARARRHWRSMPTASGWIWERYPWLRRQRHWEEPAQKKSWSRSWGRRAEEMIPGPICTQLRIESARRRHGDPCRRLLKGNMRGRGKEREHCGCPRRDEKGKN